MQTNTMHLHFIAIGGAAMHSLAIELKHKGHRITGSDDEIFDPAKSNLLLAGILPDKAGWYPDKISGEVDAVILGMHAQIDNPELQKALTLNIPVYSFPEFLYNETAEKLRVVIAGSHGKTTITSMVMHVLKAGGMAFDYMVGSRPVGFDNMVELDKDHKVAVFEGDEYLSSCLDQRPKFHVYQPEVALISGIAWDHINVFPTYGSYEEQFRIFMEGLPAGGSLIYCDEDTDLKALAEWVDTKAEKLPYSTHAYHVEAGKTYLMHEGSRIPVHVFGKHNMKNIAGARLICKRIGLTDEQFYKGIATFKGAARRLEVLAQDSATVVLNDFAHSPSKVDATVKAVREQYPERKLLAVLELHTYSSLNKNFLNHYRDTMAAADQAVVYYSPDTIRHKRLEMIDPDEVRQAFNREDLRVFVTQQELEDFLSNETWQSWSLLFMSSGNFSGIDLKALAQKILA